MYGRINHLEISNSFKLCLALCESVDQAVVFIAALNALDSCLNFAFTGKIDLKWFEPLIVMLSSGTQEIRCAWMLRPATFLLGANRLHVEFIPHAVVYS